MTLFWLLAAGLGLAAVGFVLAPLRRPRHDANSQVPDRRAVHRDRLRELIEERDAGRINADDFDQLREELDAAVLDDSPEPGQDQGKVAGLRAGGGLPVVLLAVLVPVLAVYAYTQVGHMADVELAAELAVLGQDAPAAADGKEHAGELPQLLAKLRQRLDDNPDDADGWFLLGRTAMELQDWGQAANAFRRAQALTGPNPAVLVLQAQALYLGNDRQLNDEGRAVVDQVLAADANNPVVLQILAMEAFRVGEFAAVAGFIDRALPAVEDPEIREYLLEGRRQALTALAERDPEAAAALAAAPDPRAAPVVIPAQADGPALLVSVDVSPAVRAGNPPSSTVFVLARDPGRGPMPLAVQRLTLADLPAEVRLDDSTAMSPAMALSGAAEVQVVARLSRSGEARRSPGDVEALAGPFALDGVQQLALVLGADSASAPTPVPGPDPGPAPTPAAAATGVALNLLVELDPALPVPAPGMAVFVYARSAAGPPMPVAVQRLTVADLPALVRLDDSMAMMPGRTLGSVGAVELVARVSASGIANAGPGDLEGRSGPLDPRAQQAVIPLRINARL